MIQNLLEHHTMKPVLLAIGIGWMVIPTVYLVVLILDMIITLYNQPKRRYRTNKPKTHSILTTKHPNVDSILYRHDLVEDVYDIIVVGSGIGGLTTASLLSQIGYKVLVLEQHPNKAGGCCHDFTSGGYRFGTGIHYVGEVNNENYYYTTTKEDDNNSAEKKKKKKKTTRKKRHPTLAMRILQSITYEDDPIVWDSLDTNFDTLCLGSSSESGSSQDDGPSTTTSPKVIEFVCGGYTKQKEHLKKQFPSPQDHESIDQFYTLVHDATQTVRPNFMFKYMTPLWLLKIFVRTGLYKYCDGGFHKFVSMSLLDVVTSITTNEELRAGKSVRLLRKQRNRGVLGGWVRYMVMLVLSSLRLTDVASFSLSLSLSLRSFFCCTHTIS